MTTFRYWCITCCNHSTILIKKEPIYYSVHVSTYNVLDFRKKRTMSNMLQKINCLKTLTKKSPIKISILYIWDQYERIAERVFQNHKTRAPCNKICRVESNLDYPDLDYLDLFPWSHFFQKSEAIKSSLILPNVCFKHCFNMFCFQKCLHHIIFTSSIIWTINSSPNESR